ncbi:hypothetical protein D5S17_28455 [Pseudonocardiaceae bacterium YIM PH 21723]|nr:hypothetical protein D5S17_28455 [Pseudonocardiaceae bacterium YIM PH 21723]
MEDDYRPPLLVPLRWVLGLVAVAVVSAFVLSGTYFARNSQLGLQDQGFGKNTTPSSDSNSWFNSRKNGTSSTVPTDPATGKPIDTSSPLQQLSDSLNHNGENTGGQLLAGANPDVAVPQVNTGTGTGGGSNTGGSHYPPPAGPATQAPPPQVTQAPPANTGPQKPNKPAPTNKTVWDCWSFCPW